VAVVTGADSGIGRATARLFAREGAKVICVDIRESGNKRIDKLIEQDGGTAVFVEGDVTKRPDCDKMITAALDHFGDLHILFNHVGGAIIGQIDDLSDEDWNSVFDRNLNSSH
jgi:3-oxoacyl-[acyl-carrier protein] reductase